MFRRLLALLWSRKEIIVANKMVVTNLCMPFVMVVLYQFMFKKQADMEKAILFMALPMAPAFVGYILPTLVSEEAEKNNQRSLRLAGVKSWEYVLSSLVFPFFLNLLYLLVLPFYLKVSWSELGASYLLVMVVSSLVIFLLFLLVALLVDSQSRASIVAIPVMMVTAFLPLFAMLDQTMEKVVSFTYMGAFAKYSTVLGQYSLGDKSFLVLVSWLCLSALAVIWATKKKQTIL